MEYLEDLISLLASKKKETIVTDGFLAALHNGNRLTVTRPHYHDYFEIIFYLGKDPSVYHHKKEQFVVQRGDIIFNSVFIPHYFEIDETKSTERFLIGLDGDFLLQYSFGKIDLMNIFSNHLPKVQKTDYASFSTYLSLIMDYLKLPDISGKQVLQRAGIYQILANLYVTYGINEETNPQVVQKNALVSKLVSYIDSHLTEDLSLPVLAKEVNYSITYISKVFKEVSGNTLIEYITQKKLSKAERLLLTDLPMKNVMEASGFNSYSYFFKIFKKKHGISPSEYRAQELNS